MDNIHIYHNALTTKDCQGICDFIDNMYKRNYKFKSDNFADCYNAKLENPEFNQYILQKNNINYNQLSQLVRFNRYQYANKLGMHLDSQFQNNMTHVFLLYLNDNFKKGETIIYDQEMNYLTTIKPETGLAVSFPISYWHEALEISNGFETKKCLAFQYSLS